MSKQVPTHQPTLWLARVRGLLQFILPALVGLSGLQAQVGDAVAPGSALSDSEVLAAIALGNSSHSPFPFVLGGSRGPTIVAVGPVGRIIIAASSAKLRHHPFTLDSVTPADRSPVIIVMVHPHGSQVTGVTMAGRLQPGATMRSIRPTRVDTTPGSDIEIRAYFSTAVLSLSDLRIIVAADTGDLSVLIGTRDRAILR